VSPARGVSQPFTTQPVELNRICASLEAVQVQLHGCERLTGPLFLGPVLLFELG